MNSLSLPLVQKTPVRSLVYVDKLVEGTLLSFWKREADGQTFFVTDDRVTLWKKWLEGQASSVRVKLSQVADADLLVPIV